MNEHHETKDLVINLSITKNFKDFTDFYDEMKNTIYKKTVDAFIELSESQQEYVVLKVEALINELQWGTDFKYERKDKGYLPKVLIPYFEEIEDYETCQIALNAYKKLSN